MTPEPSRTPDPNSIDLDSAALGGIGSGRRVGIAVVGLGGAVATTAAAGLELLRLGLSGEEGLPLAGTPGLVPYSDLVIGGWDLSSDDLATAAEQHGVLDMHQLAAATPGLSKIRPWAASGNAEFCRNVVGENVLDSNVHGSTIDLDQRSSGLRAEIDSLRADLRRFRDDAGLDSVVVVNLASTERTPDPASPALASIDAFEAGLDAGDPAISPAMLYAYAAIVEGAPYANFTPSLAADVPALRDLAYRYGVPVAGKDGKTGQTMMKTVIAPALRSRALKVEGWYSTNILGNRDGLALDDPASLASKIGTKGKVLDSMLGYEVRDHVVRIDYYRPRGDQKEAWDNIDVVGFLGQRMQLKIDFLCRDSVLAAPLALELARLLDLASRRGEAGPQEQLGYFFKAPMTVDPAAEPLHAMHAQEQVLQDWLADAPPYPTAPVRA
ncbi:MAG: myo-inositol-phosphate synthase, partial [Frankiaceae bacterium]|nr:myo-inositol-phosphate synthase [Frankiaceae bacterium]